MAAVKHAQSADQSVNDVAKELSISGTTGWAMDTRLRDTLVLSALNQAIGREHPDEGLLVNTDRGSQYTSQRFQALLMRFGFR